MSERAGAALRLPVDDASIARCARALREGRLVAFPTETVYGLGALATSEAAVRRIFEAKGRPLTDPLIVHVPSLAAALALLAVDATVLAALRALGAALWPGPLTLVARAAASIPRLVTAGGADVGVRVPAHPVARRLLEAAGVPVAAPSANRFGHVSPTTADHVLADLGASGALVLDGGSCPVGIESTVARVDAEGVTVLRRGAVSAATLGAVLRAAGLALPVGVRERHLPGGASAADAPGQLLVHYAPAQPTYLLASDASGGDGARRAGAAPSPVSGAGLHARRDGGAGLDVLPLAGCAVIDFAARRRALAARCRHYRDLSPAGDPVEAAAHLFAALRDAEAAAPLAILVPDLAAPAPPSRTAAPAADEPAPGSAAPVDDAPDREALLAVHDRLFRAASGRHAILDDPDRVLVLGLPPTGSWSTS